ncbi:MAG: hypothetical protein QGG53_34880 [Planctomycetota bacterium]|jgi:hypothetical protein|nr:hypothetical protein [Planctomycetota bacterium]
MNEILGISGERFFVTMATMVSLVFLLVLWIIVRLETKMRIIEKKLDTIGDNAAEMVQMGMKYFGDKK